MVDGASIISGGIEFHIGTIRFEKKKRLTFNFDNGIDNFKAWPLNDLLEVRLTKLEESKHIM